MQWTSLNDLREQYLTFFESKGHLRHKSYPLVPNGDKSVLLINAGMTPLKKYFTGEEEPPRHRMTTCQKCIRTPDIERVGITARHGTYFEMLGNFSFGDYFKSEAIPWAWEFCTEVLKLPKEKLWVTIYLDDDEAFEIWKGLGMPEERIVRLGKEDNFWEHGSGPCGPCSEIHFDRGEEYGCGSPDCKPGCDCDRFMEFWNLVFTQFDNDGHGNYTRLARPNIDTGMGLERLACLMQGVNNLFEVDTVRNIMLAICEKAGVEYGADRDSDISLRVITDHIRSTTFLVCDGVVPANEGRGYVLRRLLRRAARHGRLLGIEGTFLSDIVAVVARENYSEYPELTEKLSYIQKVVSTEEERFAATIDSGLEILRDMAEKTKASGSAVLCGADVFKLNDTFGFPIDLTREIAGEYDLGIDEDGYCALMAEQKKRAREARAAMGDLGWSSDALSAAADLDKTVFEGYSSNVSDGCEVIALIDPQNSEKIDRKDEGQVIVVLDRTPFYGEGGGQVGDSGYIGCDGALLRVVDTKKNNGVYLHECEIEKGEIAVGDKVKAEVDADRREAIRRNHSAVHLLQAALRRVLGSHVEQAGSYVDENRARFDFSHFAAMTTEEIERTEAAVNAEILRGLAVETTETDVDSAKKMGATALFGEKYGAVVRVVKMGDFSCELCGGTHIDNTAKLGLFKITSESGVAAGVRRIEGTAGYGVLALLSERDRLISDTARELKVANVSDIARRAAQLQGELRDAHREIESLNSRLASAQTAGILSGAVTVGAVRVAVKKTEGQPLDTARAVCDEIKASESDVVAVLSVCCDGKINFVCSCGADAVKAGAHAGNILKQISAIAGGKGGGRPDSATSGAKDADKIDEALAAVAETVEAMLK